MGQPAPEPPKPHRITPGKEIRLRIEPRRALKDEIPWNGNVSKISRIRGAEAKDQQQPIAPTELERLIRDVDREIQWLINGLATECNAHISVMRMEPTLRRPQPPYFYEQIKFYYEVAGADGGTVEKVVTWFLPYLLRDAAFSYAPWDVRGVLSAFPSKGMLDVLNHVREKGTKGRTKKVPMQSD